MIAPDRLYVGDMAGQITVNLHPYNYGVESTFCSTKDADDLKNLVSEPFDSMDIISDCMVND